MQYIAGSDLFFFTEAGGEFNDRMSIFNIRGKSEWFEIRADVQYSTCPVKKDDVKAESHEAGMHHAAGKQHQSSVFRQVFFTHQTRQSAQKIISCENMSQKI